MLHGTSPIRDIVLIFVPIRRRTCRPSRACTPSSPLIHRWTGASTAAGGGVLIAQTDVMSSYGVSGGYILLLPCTNKIIVSRNT